MSDKFLSTGGSGNNNISNGTINAFVAGITVANLKASMPLKTNSVNTLVSSRLDIADINNLESRLDDAAGGGVTNPYVGTLEVTDLETTDYFSLNTELQKIDNFTASTATETNLTGTLICAEVATDVIYDASQTTYIDMNAVNVTVFASDLTLNGSSVITAAGNKNITDTLTTTQTTFTQDQELITKKYVDDATPANVIVDDDTTVQTMLGALKIDDGAFLIEDTITTSAATTTFGSKVSLGYSFTIAEPITITHFKVLASKWQSSATLRKMRIYYLDAGVPTIICEANIDKLSLVDGWYETAVGPFVLPAREYSTSCLYDGANGDLYDATARTYTTKFTGVSMYVNYSTSGDDPLFPADTWTAGTGGTIGQFRFSTGIYTYLESKRINNANGSIFNVGEPVEAKDAATKNYVDVATNYGKTPSMRMVGYNQTDLSKYVNNISAPNSYSETLVITDDHGEVMVANAYIGGSFCPSLNRIYFAPHGQANQTSWHFINCKLGKFNDYIHGATVVSNGYSGSVYSPTQNRIYFIPFEQASQNQWHYIDCDDNGTIVAYTHGVTAVSQAYAGGVYSPLQNRIYLVPYAQANQNQWHYIDCSDGSVVAYTHGATAVLNAYSGGVYSHSKNRLYLVPFAQANQTQWHYINCSNGDINAYTHSATAVVNAYNGGVYSPTQNRIYFIPYTQAPQTQWHYLNCSNNVVVAYTHGATVSANGYNGGSLMPTQNRIYLVPYGQANQTNWHYIDCSNGSIVSYVNRATAVVNAYNRCIYSPHENEIYMAPYSQGPELLYHTLLPLTSGGVSLSFASSTLMGN
jgi:hypothetical protein